MRALYRSIQQLHKTISKKIATINQGFLSDKETLLEFNGANASFFCPCNWNVGTRIPLDLL